MALRPSLLLWCHKSSSGSETGNCSALGLLSHSLQACEALRLRRTSYKQILGLGYIHPLLVLTLSEIHGNMHFGFGQWLQHLTSFNLHLNVSCVKYKFFLFFIIYIISQYLFIFELAIYILTFLFSFNFLFVCLKKKNQLAAKGTFEICKFLALKSFYLFHFSGISTIFNSFS